MPEFLSIPGGYSLPLGHKLALSATAGTAVYFSVTDDEWNWQDAVVIGGATYSMFGLWVPPPLKAVLIAKVAIWTAPAVPYIAGAAIGLVVGDIIAQQVDPDKGKEKFREFYGDVTKIPERTWWSAKTIVKEALIPKVEEALVFVKTMSKFLAPVFENRWQTGPYFDI